MRGPGAEPVPRRQAAGLHRRLEREGSTFRSIQAHIRESLALELLSSTTLTIEQVAYRLGYSETAAFSRVFKRWTRFSPSRLRHDAIHFGADAAPLGVDQRRQ